MTDDQDKIKELLGINFNLVNLTKQMNVLPIREEIQSLIETQKKMSSMIPKFQIPHGLIPKFDFPSYNNLIPKLPNYELLYNTKLFDSLKEISKLGKKLNNNPELQFAFITDLEILNIKSTEELKNTLIENLSDSTIDEKEAILNTNLIPLLSELDLHNLWNGANETLKSDNPDKLRHCLISLRTILEYLIDEKLVPNHKIKDIEIFEKEFKNYHRGKQEIDSVKVYRSKKIEYFTSQFKFRLLEEFTQKDINYVCDCYSILCNVHQPNVGITENQVRSLKVKTGITIWLLCYLYKIQQN